MKTGVSYPLLLLVFTLLKEDLIQAQTEKGLQGMDDRLSESSEEAIVVTDEIKGSLLLSGLFSR